MEDIAVSSKRSFRALNILCCRLQWDKEAFKAKRRRYTAKEDSFIKKWTNQGYTAHKIARALGRTQKAIEKRIRHLVE